MEGKKFSSSRQVVIYVRDFLDRYDVDALRYYIAVAGPENQDTDFTWQEFVDRNNGELVAAWGNLVNRSVSMAAKNFGVDPRGGRPHRRRPGAAGARRARLRAPVGAELSRSRFKNAITEAFDVVREANKYLAEQEPWKIKDDPPRQKTILHVALQVVDDAKTLLTPFLPNCSNKVYAMLGGDGRLVRACRRSTRSPRTTARLPGDHRRLRGRGPLGAPADQGGHPARPAGAAVHQARPEGRRERSWPAWPTESVAGAPPARRRARVPQV